VGKDACQHKGDEDKKLQDEVLAERLGNRVDVYVAMFIVSRKVLRIQHTIELQAVTCPILRMASTISARNVSVHARNAHRRQGQAQHRDENRPKHDWSIMARFPPCLPAAMSKRTHSSYTRSLLSVRS